MKRTAFILSTLLFLSISCFAQADRRYDNGRDQDRDRDRNRDRAEGPRESSTLSIFSENGARFFMVLNGVNQNNVASSKIRVEGLPEYGNDVQINFEESRVPSIRKRITIADPVDGREVNMTLKISRGRDGYPRLKFIKCSEIERNYHPQGDEYVMSYGRPQQANTVTETTYVDPATGQTVTQTTTTTTNANDVRYDVAPVAVPAPPPPPPTPVCMDLQTFNDARTAISGGSFEETKLSTAKTILNTNYVNTNQVIEICKMFDFETTKQAFAQFAYARTVDPNNYYKVASVFNFDSDKKTLNDFISRNQR